LPSRRRIFGSERAKSGGGEGEETFCPRAGSEAPPPRAFSAEAEQKNCLYIFFILCAPVFILNEKVIFLRGSAAWRRGGAIGFF